ncbi:MAG: glycoside hydrolase family 3 protein [Gammaproteobacteria bacterium]|nr:glycoside hydrolase family 3 protein [Gammaproteobacteria bacterium]
MKMRQLQSFVWAFLLLAAAAAAESSQWPAQSSPFPADAAEEARLDQILSGMSLRDKVGQVIMGEIQYVSPRDVRHYRLGAVLNGGGSFPGKDRHALAADWLALADAYHEASIDRNDGRPAIPVIWGTDAVHGANNVFGATLFPHNIGLGATAHPELLALIGAATAREVAATGIYWNFAPTLAVPRNDRWGRTYEGYSEHPDLVAELGAALIEGMQGAVGRDFMAPGKVLATAKHFLGDGGTTDGVDQGNTEVGEDELARIHASGYRTALGSGAQTVMVSFSSWNGLKMHANPYLLREVLKGRMGFDGFLVGDWDGHSQVPGCKASSCPEAFNAGVDMFMAPQHWKGLHRNLLRQVRMGEITGARLDDAVRRILRVKLRAGLLEAPRPSSRPVAPGSDGDAASRSDWIGHPRHRALARRAVRESLVLLKNEGSVLPIAPQSTVLVTGAAAANIPSQLGGWSMTWQGDDIENSDFPGATSILDGIRSAVDGAGGTVSYRPFADLRAGLTDSLPEVALLVYGEEPYAEYEGDVGTLEFSPREKSHLEAARILKAAGVPVVSVLLNGRPLAVPDEIKASDAFVVAWLPGTEGAGVADVLIATPDGAPHFDFRGRLPFSWPHSPDQAEINRGDDLYQPAYPFGFGLRYKPPDAS